MSDLIEVCVIELRESGALIGATEEMQRLGDLEWWRKQHGDLVRRLATRSHKGSAAPRAGTQMWSGETLETVRARIGTSRPMVAEEETSPAGRIVMRAGVSAGRSEELERLELHQRNDRHFRPRARGVDHAGDRGDYFTARTTALRELATWLRGDRHDRKARVVTGRPGSGKSALLGRLLMLADPDEPARAQADPDTLPPAGLEIVPLYARRATRESLTQDLASTLGTPEADLGELLQIVAERPRPLVVVVDALDEAGTGGDPYEGMRIGRELLRPMTSMPTVRLIIGTRDPFIGTLGSAVTVLDLDDTHYFGANDVVDYARDVLLDAHDPDSLSPYRDDLAAATTIGRAIADRAGTSFLVARMTARALVDGQITIDTTRPGWRDTLPSDAKEAFAAYLARFGDNRLRIESLLRPLAYAQGSGLPWSTLWTAIAAALSGLPCSQDDLRWLLEYAGAYVIESATHNNLVFRLVHETMAELLRAPGADTDAHRAITVALVGQVPDNRNSGGKDWANAHPYILRHLAAHAAAAGAVDNLIADPSYLVHAEPDTLLPALRYVTTDIGATIRAIYRTSAHYHRRLDPHNRRHILALDAARFGAHALACELALPLGWKPRWATSAQTATALFSTLTGHNGPIRAAACAIVEGNAVAVTASHGSRGSMHIWDLSTSELRMTINGYTDWISAVVCMVIDGTPVAVSASGAKIGKIHTYDLRTGELLGVITDQDGSIHVVATAGIEGSSLIVTGGGGDGAVRVWDLITGDLLQTLGHHTDWVQGVACTTINGCPVAITGSRDGSVLVWDLGEGRLRNVLVVSTNPTFEGVEAVACAVIDECPTAVVGLFNGTVQVWNLNTGEPRGTFHHTSSVCDVTCAVLDGRPIAVIGGRDGVVRVWDLKNGELNSTFAGHTDYVEAVACTEIDGHPVAVTGGGGSGMRRDDGTIRVWSLLESVDSVRIGHSADIRAVVSTVANGRPVAITGGEDGVVRTWDSITGKIGVTINLADSVWALACTVIDGRAVVLTGGVRQAVRLWDLITGELLGTLVNSWHVLNLACATLDGRPIAVTSGLGSGEYRDAAIVVWDLITGEIITTLVESFDPPRSVDCAMLNGCLVVVSCDDEELTVWTPTSGELIRTVRLVGRARVMACTTIDDRPIAVIGNWDGNIKLWSWSTGEQYSTFRGHTAPVTELICTVLDGNPVVISGSEDGVVRLWNLVNRSGTIVLQRAKPGPLSVSLAGGWILAAGWDLVVLDRISRREH
ncbi:NACHT domain-containing protein [Amycolatopsis sp. cmx-4-61]|uniref:NACHT domain-containing protein n=1 Tax=Amycolatopsis sp. cmx-4-61 TaxID=2790937 RepID=UPI00397B3FBC